MKYGKEGLSDIQTLSSETARKLDIYAATFMINTLRKYTVLVRFCREIYIWYVIVFSTLCQGAYGCKICLLNYIWNP